MTCYCIGRNYRDHAKELNNPVPKKPLVFSKPGTAVRLPGQAAVYPPFTEELHFETELVLRIGMEAKSLAEEDAWTAVDAITLGLDLTARDVQARCKEKGHPWEVAKAWDGSAPIGRFVPVPESLKGEGLVFAAYRNGRRVQVGHTSDMLFPIPELLVYLTGFFTLMPGDLVFTGTPAGVGPVQPGDRFQALLMPDGEDQARNPSLQQAAATSPDPSPDSIPDSSTMPKLATPPEVLPSPDGPKSEQALLQHLLLDVEIKTS
jgi:2-keto-4-pentenoate hydratase/2-oxohepta-3-ene-1,7-dioic acid hydratase in catechol pathway